MAEIYLEYSAVNWIVGAERLPWEQRVHVRNYLLSKFPLNTLTATRSINNQVAVPTQLKSDQTGYGVKGQTTIIIQGGSSPIPPTPPGFISKTNPYKLGYNQIRVNFLNFNPSLQKILTDNLPTYEIPPDVWFYTGTTPLRLRAAAIRYVGTWQDVQRWIQSQRPGQQQQPQQPQRFQQQQQQSPYDPNSFQQQ